MNELVYSLAKKVVTPPGVIPLENHVISVINGRMLSGPPRRNIIGGFGNLAPTIVLTNMHHRSVAASLHVPGYRNW